jgi:Na+-driven multidrug efflux pump
MKGTFLALTRQIIFLLPLIVVLPMIFGINGIMYAAPIADGGAAVISIIVIRGIFRKMGE